jgi:hypothetical protein
MALDKSKKIFGRTPTRGYVYQWQPSDSDKSAKTTGHVRPKTGCDATAYSQGDDNTNSYVYNTYLVGVITHRSAYVACDYVK